MTNLINCGTCGYPLTPEERASLIERDGVMVKPTVQEPDGYVYGNSYWEATNPRITDDVKRFGSPRYATPPAAQRQWTPMSKELLTSQVHWLYKQMWIALKDGSVMTGVYDWRQGRYPDRLLLDGAGDVWAFEAEYVMPVVQPEHPNKLKEKNT
jgi:hypothetical protein